MREGIFPDDWKFQILVLIPNGEYPAPDSTSFRLYATLCMLNSVGKIHI